MVEVDLDVQIQVQLQIMKVVGNTSTNRTRCAQTQPMRATSKITRLNN